MNIRMQKLTGLVLSLFLVCGLMLPALPAFAVQDAALPRVVDESDLLIDGEEEALSRRITVLGKNQQFDIVILIAEDWEDQDVFAYIDAFYNRGYGYGAEKDGIIFAMSLAENQAAISSYGRGKTIFPDDRCAEIIRQMTEDISGGRYFNAMLTYIRLTEEGLLQDAQSGQEPDPGTTETVSDKKVVDDADLLSAEEEEKLSERIMQILAEYPFDIVIVTTDSLEGKTATEYADDYFDYNGYGYGAEKDGILFAIGMAERKWAISTTGYGIRAFTDYYCDLIGENMVPYLSDGAYYLAFSTYLDMVERGLAQAAEGDPFDVDENDPAYDDHADNRGPFGTDPFLLALGSVIGLVLSALIVGFFAMQLKTAVPRNSASDYGNEDSFHNLRSDDVFVTSHTSRTKIQSSSSGGGSSTHSGSSGSSHGGSSGSF